MDVGISILWKSYKQSKNDYYRDRLIENYKPFLRRIVNNIYSKIPKTMDIYDLENYAYVGLIDAINRYDLNRNIEFETYASYRIKGAVLDGIRKHDWLSRSMRAKYKNPLDDDEGLQQDRFNMISLDDPNFYEKKEEETSNYIQNLYEFYNSNNSEFAEKIENILFFKEIISKLTPIEKKIVYLYYFKGKTFKDIGKILKISESRVSQINKKILLFIRKKINSANLILS